ncbi:MAG: hypothetical protein WBG92_07030 [Thiohalocapsa sp.]
MEQFVVSRVEPALLIAFTADFASAWVSASARMAGQADAGQRRQGIPQPEGAGVEQVELRGFVEPILGEQLLNL